MNDSSDYLVNKKTKKADLEGEEDGTLIGVNRQITKLQGKY